MQKVMELIFRKYGRELTLRSRGNVCCVRAFLQPVSPEKGQALQPGLLGIEGQERFAYFGPLEPEVLPGDELDDGKDRFLVCQAQTIFGTTHAAYIWGSCLRKGGTAPWSKAGWNDSPNC